MKLSLAGRKLLTDLEGYRNGKYLDSSGYPTIGVGHLINYSYDPNLTKVTGMAPNNVKRLTDAQVDKLLELDLSDFALKFINHLPNSTTQSQFDAISSFAHNIGTGALIKSTFLRLFKEGDIQGAADAMLKFNRSAGNVVPGLAKRRHVERLVFLNSAADLNSQVNLTGTQKAEIRNIFNTYKINTTQIV